MFRAPASKKAGQSGLTAVSASLLRPPLFLSSSLVVVVFATVAAAIEGAGQVGGVSERVDGDEQCPVLGEDG